MKVKSASRRRASNLDPVKNAIRGALSDERKSLLTEVIGNTVYSIQEEDIPALSHWVSTYAVKKGRIWPPDKIQKFKDLNPPPLGKDTKADLKRQLYWCIEYLAQNKAKLSTFVHQLHLLEGHWMSGALSKAGAVLDEIESELGLSLWGIEARIAILQQSKGMEAQKQYMQTIRESCPNTITSFAAVFLSQRNEASVSFARFGSRIQKTIDIQKLPDSAKRFLRCQLTGELPSTGGEIASVLRVASVISLIDTYEKVIYCIQTAIINDIEIDELKGPINKLNQMNLGDWRIAKLHAFSNSDFSALPLFSSTPLKLAIQQDYTALAKEASLRIAENPCDLEHLNFLALAYAHGVEKTSGQLSPVQEKILDALTQAHERGESLNSAANDLIKELLNCRAMRFMPSLIGTIGLIWHEHPQVKHSEGTWTYLSTPTLTLAQWQVLSEGAANQLICIYAAQDPSDLAVIAASTQLSGALFEHSDVPFDAASEINMNAALYKGNLLGALTHVKKLSNSNDPIFRRLAAKIELHCLVRMQRLDEAIRRVSTYCCDDEGLRQNLPLHSLLKGLKWRDIKHLKSEIALPISLDLHQRTVNDASHETNLRIAYDEFLRANKCEKPCDLIAIRENFTDPELIYFLRWISVPKVMDVSFDVFPTSRAIEEHRIMVCSRLTELDQENSSEYAEEVRRITTLLSVQDGLKAVDGSRVHVNLEGLARWAEIEFKEGFERYKTFLKSNIGFGSPQAFDEALNKYTAGDAAAAEDYLTYPTLEGDDLLIDMFDSIKDKYLSDPDFGLDAYLSMRIRHGSLEGHMRGPLQEHSLINQKNEATGKYDDNTDWTQHLRLSDVEAIPFFAAFQKLSKRYDGLIEELTKDLLQIQRPEKPKGFFHLRIEANPLIIHFCRCRIQESTTFDEFLSNIIFGIETLLHPVLLGVRKYILEKVKADVDAAFEELRSDLEAAILPMSFHIINSAIADVMPTVQSTIDRIADWFVPVQQKDDGILRTVSEIVDIGIEATKLARRGFNPVITREIDEIGVLTPSVLSEFTDILFTILDNVYCHSGNRVSPEVFIKIKSEEITDTGRRIRILVDSEVAQGVYNEQAVEKLSRIRAQMTSGAYRRLANLEGGSGLLKLKKLAAVDTRQTIDFGFKDESTFYVDLCLWFTIAKDHGAAA